MSCQAARQLCACGCGETAPIATKTNKRYGHVKGRPVRFVRGHGRRLSGVPFLERDTGYETSCWIWQRARNRGGYGQKFDGTMMRSAHRVYYERQYGELREGLVLDHLCRVRACVNPSHLEPVSHTENVRRGRLARRREAPEDPTKARQPESPRHHIRELYENFIRVRNTRSWREGDGLLVVQQDRRYSLLANDATIAYGQCLCGCGNKTRIAERNEYRRGHVKGEPMPTLLGHSRRVRAPHYRVESTGYESPCYLWNHGKTGCGYAQMSFGRKTVLVHRSTYESAYAEVPGDLELHHLCERRDCIRPDHLEALTHATHARKSSYAKLSMKKAHEIRVSTDKVSSLAACYGVSPTIISEIRGGIKWNEAVL